MSSAADRATGVCDAERAAEAAATNTVRGLRQEARLRDRAAGTRLAFLLLSCTLLLAPPTRAAPPTFADVRAAWQPSEAWLLDRHGAVLQELRLDSQVRRTDWTALADISPAMLAATLLAEDQRFFDHSGIDWLAVGHAALTNWLSSRPRGASTLSMQLAALLDADLRARAGRRDVAEKWQQMQAARELESAWSKHEILEAYLNRVSFRGDLMGIDAAARALFDKRPAGLGTAESLLLASLIRAPGAKAEAVARRACALAAALPGGPSCAGLRGLARNTLTGRHPIVPGVDLAPQLARQLLTRPGQRHVSSLDRDLQQGVTRLLGEQLARLAGHAVADAAALVVDNASGDALAYVSLSRLESASPHSDGVRAPRQAGSTLKPFLYALALDKRYLTAASPLDDRPLSLATASGQYAPENYDHRYRGLASVREALAGSLNIPAVHTLELVGPDLFAERLADLGFAGLTEAADYYGPALALGSLDVSLWELVNAYRTLANGGRQSPLRLERGSPPTPGKRQYSGEASFLVADILADRQARAGTFGLDNVLATPYWTAVKTGTSKDMRDNWCVGFSTRYSVGVWLGNFTGEPMHAVSGVSGAAPAWRQIMDRLHAHLPSLPPEAPPGLLRRTVVPPGEPPRREWFLAGTEPAAATWQAARPPARIVTPADGSLLALDPDIPSDRQHLTFTARHAEADSRWRLDGETLPSAEWIIRRGRHVLSLVDSQDIELDRVAFEVR